MASDDINHGSIVSVFEYVIVCVCSYLFWLLLTFQFNGTWYVISKIGTRSDCLTVNYNLMGDDQSFRIEEMRRPPYADVTPLDMVVTNAGMLNRLGAASKYTVTWFNGK